MTSTTWTQMTLHRHLHHPATTTTTSEDLEVMPVVRPASRFNPLSHTFLSFVWFFPNLHELLVLWFCTTYQKISSLTLIGKKLDVCLIRYGYVDSTFHKLLIGHTYGIKTPLKCTTLTNFRSLWFMLLSKKGWSLSGSHRKTREKWRERRYFWSGRGYNLQKHRQL